MGRTGEGPPCRRRRLSALGAARSVVLIASTVLVVTACGKIEMAGGIPAVLSVDTPANCTNAIARVKTYRYADGSTAVERTADLVQSFKRVRESTSDGEWQVSDTRLDAADPQTCAVSFEFTSSGQRRSAQWSYDSRRDLIRPLNALAGA